MEMEPVTKIIDTLLDPENLIETLQHCNVKCACITFNDDSTVDIDCAARCREGACDCQK
jgi:hypothetical protein